MINYWNIINKLIKNLNSDIFVNGYFENLAEIRELKKGIVQKNKLINNLKNSRIIKTSNFFRKILGLKLIEFWIF